MTIMEEPASGQRDSSRMRRLGETALWSLIVAVAVLAVLRVATALRLVVLPVLFAVIAATLLEPPVRWLKQRRFPDGAAAFTVLALALLAFAGIFVVVIPPTIDELGQLDIGVRGAVDQVQAWIVESPLPISTEQLSDGIDRLQEQIGAGVEAITGPIVTGVFIAIEVLAGVALTIVVLFFLLKDGERIWAWLVGFVPARRRHDVHRLGTRSWDALGAFVRGQTLVALFDAVFIGLALLVIGVPLVLPLAVLTFFGAYVPVIGATVAGGLAVLVALASEGVVPAAAVLGAILAVQQVEGNLLQPVVVGRAIRVHPLAVLLGVTAGAVLAGIIGAMIAAPLVAVAGATLDHLRQAEPAAEA